MSYFTDESEYKSSGGVVDPLDIAGPRPTGGQEAGAYFDKTFNTDLLISESVNERRALEERMNIISEHSGIDTMEALKPHGYEEGFFSGKGDPWLSSGRSDDFEKAVEAYANANPDVKGKLFYGEGIRQRAKEIAQAEDKRTSKIIERGKNGWWPAFVGSAGAYAVDPLFVMTQMIAPEIAFGRLAAKGVQMGFGARVGTRAGIDAAAGFAYELPAQKLAVQPYKQSLGIEHSDSDVAMNVFLGTVLGGAFGGAFEGLAGGFRKLKTGEWTPKELNEWAAKERPNMPPEEQQALDMAIQAVEHEKLNPYGPEGRDKFNREMATFNERADTNERLPSDIELEKAVTDMEKAMTPEEVEFQELRAYSREQAGIIDDIPEQAVKQPDANPLGEYEAQLRTITDGLEVGDDVALNTLTSSGIDEATARQAIDYAINNGILTKDADGKLTFARKVDDQNPVLKTDSEDTPKLNARELDSDVLKKNSLKGEDVATKINGSTDEVGANQFMRLKKTNPEIYNDLTQLKKDAGRILPDDVETLFPMFLDDAHGVYHRGDKIVMVARDHPDIETALRHEALHALRTRIKTPEWEMLVEASRKIEFPKEELYKKRLTDSFEDLEDVKDILIRDGLNEERVANLIEYAYNGGDISILEPKPKNLIAKAVQYLKALITTLKAPKYNKLRAFLEDFENGIIAKRAEREDIDYAAESLFSMDENPQQQRWFTPEFKKWFGDSKVVDDDGNPLVVYHGTNGSFDEDFVFKHTMIGDNGSAEGYGFYFTDDRTLAEGYAKGDLGAFYLTIENPLNLQSRFTYDELSKIIDRTVDLQISKYSDEIKDYKETFLSDYVDTYSTDRKTAVQQVADMLHGSDDVAVDSIAEIANVVGDKKIALRATTDATGYDGVLARQTDAEGREYENIFVAFNAEQIKSVNNRGTFDPNDPRIMYSLKETPQPRGTPEGQNLTPEFKKWFAGSKVVDDEGKPLKLYHQTHRDNAHSIENEKGFDVSLVGARGTDDRMPDGVFLKPDDRDIGIGSAHEDERVQMPVYAKLEKPLVVINDRQLRNIVNDKEHLNLWRKSREVDSANAKEWDEIYRLIDEGADEATIDKARSEIKERTKKAGRDAAGAARARLTKVLKERGYDGVIILEDEGSFGRKTETYIIFDPTQIKSVNNKGTFDPNDPRILYSLKENQKTATLDELTIDIDGQQMSVKELFKSADNDIAMAENIKLCASLGA